jgi:hypothetical protein
VAVSWWLPGEVVEESHEHEKVAPELLAVSSEQAGRPEMENSTRAIVPESSVAVDCSVRAPVTLSPAV